MKPTLLPRRCSLHPPPCPSPKGSLVAIRVMKHQATGGHALRGDGRSSYPPPTQSAQPWGAPPRTAPGPHPNPGVGAPRASPPRQLPRVPGRTEVDPSPAAPKLRVTFPITPSRLPACTPEGWSAERSDAARREPGERPSSLSPSSPPRPQRSRRRQSWLGPRAAPRPLAPSLAWRRTGNPASRRAGSAPQEGKEREGPANAAAASVAAESARSALPASAPRGPAPAASWSVQKAARGPRPGAYNSRHARGRRRFRALAGACGACREGVSRASHAPAAYSRWSHPCLACSVKASSG